MRIPNVKAAVLVLAFGVFALIISLAPSTDAQLLQTITLVSGSGALGNTDPANEMSTDGGVTWNPAVIVAQGQNGYPVSLPYDTIPGTNYISTAADGSTPQFSTALYRTTFTLPSNFQFPSLIVNVHVDNLVNIILNGTVISTQPLNTCCPAVYFQNPPETYAAVNASLFQPGPNTLEFLVYNHSNRSALDYKAQVSYALLNPPGINPCLNPTIVGTPGTDAIVALGPGNIIDGKGGNDAIVTGPFNDIICGGTGNDVIASGSGNDLIFGGPGNDVMDGGPHTDVLLGEQGNDKHHGGTGIDVCFDIQGINMFSLCP